MKKKILALVISGAIMVMGAGYAGWTETVTINNTVGTGELNIDVQAGGSALVYQDASATVVDGLTRTATVTVDAADPETNTATVNVDNLYPGAEVDVTVPVKNAGSIPAKLVGVTDNLTVSEWVTVTAKNAPADLAVNAEGNVTYTINVLDSAPEKASLSFKVAADYKQFNQ